MSAQQTAQDYARDSAAPPFAEPGLASLSGLMLAPAAALSIIVPTFNERDNVANLIAAVSEALPGIAWEIVFVDDDSPDGTASFVREIAQADPRVRCLHRYGRRGLSSACVEGIMATSAPIVAVIDGDGQHDERALYRMFKLLAEADADIAVGSRYVAGGGVNDWDRKRLAMSRLATRVANRIIGGTLSDPMSGFFMMRREAFLASLPRLSCIGFKILLDISASSERSLKIVEVPYQFRARWLGESKLDAMAIWEFFLLLLDKTLGRYMPARFVGSALIGGAGVFVYLALLTLAYKFWNTGFLFAQSTATFAAMTANFLLANTLAYRGQRLKGNRLLLGWLRFNLIGAVGALANIAIAASMFTANSMWLADGLTGLAVGIAWNHLMSSFFARGPLGA